MIIREERHRVVARTKEDRQENAVSFAVRTNRPGQYGVPILDKSTLLCSICHKQGHEAKDCFQVIGYPDWWKEKNKSTGLGGSSRRAGGNSGRGRQLDSSISQQARALAVNAQVGSITSGASRCAGKEISGLPGLSSEQWTTLLNMLNTNQA